MNLDRDAEANEFFRVMILKGKFLEYTKALEEKGEAHFSANPNDRGYSDRESYINDLKQVVLMEYGPGLFTIKYRPDPKNQDRMIVEVIPTAK